MGRGASTRRPAIELGGVAGIERQELHVSGDGMVVWTVGQRVDVFDPTGPALGHLPSHEASGLLHLTGGDLVVADEPFLAPAKAPAGTVPAPYRQNCTTRRWHLGDGMLARSFPGCGTTALP